MRSATSLCTGAPSRSAAVNPSVVSSASTLRRSVSGSTRWSFASAPSTGSLAGSRPADVRRQPENHDDRLVVREHQRREPVAGSDPVAAADAALALDGDVEVLQRLM